MTEEKKDNTEEEKDMAEEEMYKTEAEMDMAEAEMDMAVADIDMPEAEMGIVTQPNPVKKKSTRSSWDGLRLWWAVMLIYIAIFTYIGYIAFWPMAFNDPDNTVKKYLTILEEYQAQNPKVDGDTLNLAMQELMKKAEESANNIQKLASQSFNIVLGAFLAFLSATVTTIFQRVGRNKEPSPEPTV